MDCQGALSLRGTAHTPMRMVVRCIGKTSDQLWHKGSSQSLYRPKDLHITHFCIYAVGPHLVHRHLLDKYMTPVVPATLPSGSQMSVFDRDDISVFSA